MSEQQLAYPPDSTIMDSAAAAHTFAELSSSGLQKDKGTSRSINILKWVVSFPAMLGTILLAVVFYETRVFFVDPDVWWHIKVGQDILRTHHWPTIDAYSFTAANTPWIAYEWLGEVILASVAKLGGNTALFVLLMATTAVVMVALYYLAALRCGNSKAAFIPPMVMSPLVLLSFTLRPQMFGYLFLVILLVVLHWFRKGVGWPLWTLPVLFLAWVNIHGSFIVGIGVLTVYLCCGLKPLQLGNIEAIAWSAKQRIELELALLLSLAVLPITPYGTRLAIYPFDMMFNQPVNVSNIVEWRPMPFDQQFGKIFLGVVVSLVVLQILFRLTWRLEEVLLAIGGTVMACIHSRMLLLFVPFFVPVFATMLARFIPSYQRAKDKYVLNAAIMAGVAAAMVHYFPSRDALQMRVSADFPVQAVAYLDSHKVPGPMLNNYYFGGYLVGTGRKVFIDGRGDLFERTGVMSDFVAISQVRSGPLGMLDRYRIASCLVIKDEPLAVVLNASPKWKRIYIDNRSAIFVRVTPIAGSGWQVQGAAAD